MSLVNKIRSIIKASFFFFGNMRKEEKTRKSFIKKKIPFLVWFGEEGRENDGVLSVVEFFPLFFSHTSYFNCFFFSFC